MASQQTGRKRGQQRTTMERRTSQNAYPNSIKNELEYNIFRRKNSEIFWGAGLTPSPDPTSFNTQHLKMTPRLYECTRAAKILPTPMVCYLICRCLVRISCSGIFRFILNYSCRFTVLLTILWPIFYGNSVYSGLISRFLDCFEKFFLNGLLSAFDRTDL